MTRAVAAARPVTAVTRLPPGRLRAAWPDLLAGAGLVGAMAVVTAGLVLKAPGQLGLLLVLGAAGLAAVVIGLGSPLVACTYLLATTFLRLAIPSGTLPVDPFLLAFAGLLGAAWLVSRPWEHRPGRIALDPVAWAMVLYIGWNLLSMELPHAYPPGSPRDPESFNLLRFALIGTVMPLSLFLLARRLFAGPRAVRVLLWSALVAAAYSAAVSTAQFSAPGLAWPRYVLENTEWPGRAVGVFNQPLVNGLVLIVGFLVAVLIASHRHERRWSRITAGVIGAASAYGVFLTHTRAVWLAFAVVVIVGAVCGRGFRAGFVLTLAGMVAVVALNWSTFTSDDRSAGGVGSPDEVQDRLNSIATSIWAVQREPVVGWGIARFASVNTFHHQQWSPEVPWERGLGIPSHLDALGVLVELGLVGLVLWLAVTTLVYRGLVRAARRLPAGDVYGRALALTALFCLLAQTITGLTVDLRFFDFPNIVVMVLAGAVIGRERQMTLREGAAVGPPVGPPVGEAVQDPAVGDAVRHPVEARVAAAATRA